MSADFLQTPIEYLKGIGPQKAEVLKKELRIFNAGQLLEYFPFRYIDRSRFYKVSEINSEISLVQIKGVLSQIEEIGSPRKTRLRAYLKDETGKIELVWFKAVKWIKDNLIPGAAYVAFGKPTLFNNQFNIAHPEMDELAKVKPNQFFGFKPVYNSSEKLGRQGLSSKGIEKVIHALLFSPNCHISETLSNEIRQELKLISRTEAIKKIHNPQNPEDIKHAQRRLKFEELFYLQIEILHRKKTRQQQSKGFIFEQVGELFNTFYRNYLPFDLTEAQKRVLKEIRADMCTGRQMNRLLQGDVGSGKTMVSLLSALIALDNGFQCSIMAPTEILANQHYESFMEALGEMPLNVALLTGSSKTAQRKKIHAGIESGEIHILIGTHALIEDKVKFKNLGLAVIDEQHRFGVAQRASLWKKNSLPPHVLVMTATPIPRTLAMTLYGDLEISVIDELPPGRKAIKTVHYFDSQRLRVFGFMEEQIKLGRQIYIVYPLIEESATLDYKDLMDGYESIVRRFPMPEYQISMVHGRMKSEDKDFEMQRFIKGETHIMVATTVIEVGVNVPNASVMIIESAQRFGLSQLHQLRGRVGRGADQSFCILMTDDKLSREARVRLKTMCDTNDGFKISEVDLKLRGPGNLLGTQQSGVLDLKIADLSSDTKILHFARETAKKILEEDPELNLTQNEPIKKQFNYLNSKKQDWSKIS